MLFFHEKQDLMMAILMVCFVELFETVSEVMEVICNNNASNGCCNHSGQANLAKYHLPAEHHGGGNNETQRNHTDVKKWGVFIQCH